MQASFKNGALAIASLYKESITSYKSGYAQGKQDAFEEVFKWFTAQNNGNFKYVPVSSFFRFMQEKMNQKQIHSTDMRIIKESLDSGNIPDETQPILDNVNSLLEAVNS